MVLLPYIDRCPYYLVHPIFIPDGTAFTAHTARCLPCSGHGYNERLKTVEESSLPNQQNRDAFSKQSMFSFILLQSMWLTQGPRGDLRQDLVFPSLVQTSKLSSASRIFQAIRLLMRNGKAPKNGKTPSANGTDTAAQGVASQGSEKKQKLKFNQEDCVTVLIICTCLAPPFLPLCFLYRLSHDQLTVAVYSFS